MNRLKTIIITGQIILMIPMLVLAQFTETKQITKRFKVTPESRIEITNKYGRIKVNTWEKDSIIFDIKIKVEEKKLSKLEKAMEEVDFDFIKSQHFIIARTKVGENRSGIEKEIANFKESVFQSDGKIEIDYVVWMPKTNQLKVENKFGDIYIDDYLGDIEINLSNGNLKSHDFQGKTTLKLSFADATINHLKTGRLDCSYSEIYIKKAGDLQVASKSSEFEIIEINSLNTDSRRDKFRIQMIDILDARGNFTNYRINEFKDKLNLITEYGDLDIEKIAIDFNSIYIESKSTDMNLYFNEKSVFDFDITHTKSQTNFSRKMVVKKEEVLDEKEKKIQLTGNFGSSAKTTKLFINASGGGINIFNY
ncbi:MAG TPA: hypothetical protein VLA03_06485 [Draconibacterium sp.]|nr:hypothetical protein [Draconibacterium sp.]